MKFRVHVKSCHVSCRVVSRRVVTCCAVPCRVVSCHAVSCRILRLSYLAFFLMCFSSLICARVAVALYATQDDLFWFHTQKKAEG